MQWQECLGDGYGWLYKSNNYGDADVMVSCVVVNSIHTLYESYMVPDSIACTLRVLVYCEPN